MFGFITKIFIGLLTSIVNALQHVCSLSYLNCTTQPNLISLHPNEYNQRLGDYPFAINLDRCVGSCNTLNDLSNKVCVSDKTEDLNLSVFNMITKMTNESKTLTTHISCKCKCKFDDRKSNSNQK